jgi:hypothetical protein
MGGVYLSLDTAVDFIAGQGRGALICQQHQFEVEDYPALPTRAIPRNPSFSLQKVILKGFCIVNVLFKGLVSPYNRCIYNLAFTS